MATLLASCPGQVLWCAGAHVECRAIYTHVGGSSGSDVLGGGRGIESIWPNGVLGKPVLASDADLFDQECFPQAVLQGCGLTGLVRVNGEQQLAWIEGSRQMVSSGGPKT